MPTSRPFNRFLLAALRFRMGPGKGYAIAIAATLLVGILRAMLITNLLPYLFFIPVILVVSVLIGRGPGVASVLVAALFAGWAFSPNENPFDLTAQQYLAQFLFVVVNLGIVWIGYELRRSVLDLETISESRRETLERLEREIGLRHRLATIVEQSRDFIGYTTLDGQVQFVNEAGRTLVGLESDPRSTEIPDYFSEDDRSRIASEILPSVSASGAWTGDVHFRNFLSGEYIPVRYNIFPLKSGAGNTIGYGTVTTDLRRERAAEIERQTLTKELAHRMKNTLAMVQAVVTQSLRHATDMHEAAAMASARIQALGRAQDMLTATDWASSKIMDVVEASIAPHADGNSRFAVEGPAVELNAQQALGIALAIHELATNSAKYGALSIESGSISIAWNLLRGDAFTFVWREEGGPPVSVPARRGFGSRLTERVVPGYFDGHAQVEYASTGVVYTLDGSLHPNRRDHS